MTVLSVFGRLSLRTRLTLVYVGLFIALCAVLLVVDYTLLAQNLPKFSGKIGGISFGQSVVVSASGQTTKTGPLSPDQVAQVSTIANDLRNQTLNLMILQSAIALAATVLVATLFGWLLAGRVVGPVKAITAQARRMSERNLHERIALKGPHDELKDLADTFDGMLARLDSAFESQRMFVANASHELRTPLAVTRTAVDVQMQRDNPTREQWQTMAEMVLASTARSERLINSLLLLARIEQGNFRREWVDFGRVLEEGAAEARGMADRRSIELTVTSHHAMVEADPDLLSRLVGNLLENAVRHNRDHGFVRASLDTADGHALLTVVNSGEIISSETAREIMQPFHRGASSRSSDAEGVGLGLSIVKSIVDAHGGSIRIRPMPEGGLEALVDLPMAD